jgi:hypothetical protein
MAGERKGKKMELGRQKRPKETCLVIQYNVWILI